MCDGKVTEHASNSVVTANEKLEPQLKWPEERDESKSRLRQVFDRWTFSYMSKILDKGARQSRQDGPRLTQDDLFRVPSSMDASFLAEKFRKHYRSAKSRKWRLASTMWHLAAPTFVPAGFCQLISVLCQVGLPLSVRELLRVLEENPNQSVVDEGLPFALLIFFASFINAFANHRYRHLAMKSGVVMRAATVIVLYEHVLKMTPLGRAGLTSGEVTNLIAVDSQKLFEVTQEGHLIWALPLSVVLVTICLLLIMGPTMLVGVAVLIMFVPIVERVTNGMMKIRKQRVKMTDKRIEITNAMLQGIKVTKLNNYEASYQKRVLEARNAELSYLYKELAVWALSLVIIVTSPVLATAAAFATYVLVDEDNILTAAKTFSVLLLFAALRFPINFAGRLIGKAAQAISAMERIAPFLERETREPSSGSNTILQERPGKSCQDTVLTLTNAGFFVSSSTENWTEAKDLEGASVIQGFQVGEFNVALKRGEVLAVAGPVGSGKSTFVSGVIDEVPAISNSIVTKYGKIAYVPQTPFILNATFRENILFGLPFRRDLYDRVIDACSLRVDIEQLGNARDLTEIGERGVTLSGGQKQRISLARAAYSQPDLVLLDDPLSALDAGTSKTVFERLLKSRDAVFSEAAVVLVTHASHFLSQVDRTTIVVDGKNKFLGTWEELMQFQPMDDATKSAVESIRTSVQEKSSESEKSDGREFPEPVRESEKVEKVGNLITIEEREHGLSSLRVWLLWFMRAGGIYFLSFQIIFMAIDRFAYVAVEYWLARWTEAATQPIDVFGVEFPPQTDGRAAQYEYLKVYASLIFISVFSTTLRSEWAVTGGYRASRRVFEAMLESIIHAPMSYFETTPMGRILNRFTYDMEVIDVTLTQTMSMFMISISWFVAGVALMCTILPWMLLAIVPVTVVYWFLLLHYRRAGADLQRLDAVSRTPIQAMISEGLDGSSTIRVFRQEATFTNRFFETVDQNSSSLLNFISAQRWLGLRIELLGSLVVLVASVLVISLNNVWEIEPGLVGLLILWSSNFTITLGFLVDTFAEVEASITAIERVDAMAHLPQEAGQVTDEAHAVPASWPEFGRVKFSNVCLRYREGLPLSLDNLSFEIPPGKRCGVVGRTGAGKSSLTVALFRIVEIESGQITLDDVDLAKLGLSDVRGRHMVIIPQDPFLTGSTLRECLDPFQKNDDADVLDALKAVRIATPDETSDILNTPLEEGGANYSVGERQLLNLAAALLSKPKVLVLDEATASIDYESDAFVQRMLRTRFKDTTLITVAHRLHTIMDYDLIMVMDKGRAVEMACPAELLARNGAFAQLVDATGAEGSKALRAMVPDKA